MTARTAFFVVGQGKISASFRYCLDGRRSGANPSHAKGRSGTILTKKYTS
jgi:hypothetical protein